MFYPGRGLMTWKEAIQAVLCQFEGALTARRISDEILARGLRNEVGANPADTVGTVLANEVRKPDSRFERVAPGTYRMRGAKSSTATKDCRVTSYGRYWVREGIDWPHLYGMFQPHGPVKSKPMPVDFSKQKGVYLLHDDREIIYVGRAVGPTASLGERLHEHTKYRLHNRWNRFSWFGFLPVLEQGDLGKPPPMLEAVVSVVESILIEAIEPRRNQQAGPGFDNMEYRQLPTPEFRALNAATSQGHAGSTTED